MSVDEQDDRKEGAVPNSFGNALAWRWSREMPRGLKGGFLTMLYALRAMAASSGQLRFRDGKPIRIQDLAKAAGCREQDARRYLDAGIRAGVVLVDGERRRGRAALYAIPGDNVRPDWRAAEDYLKATARRRTPDGSSGHSGTNPVDESSGHRGTNQIGPQRHEPEPTDDDPVRATEARWGSGHSGTTGSGHGGTNNPGITHGVPQEVAEVVPQPEVVGGESASREQIPEQDDDEPFGRCEVCKVPLMRAGKRCSAHREALARRRPREGRSKPVQGPLLMPVPTTPAEPRQDVPAAFQPPPTDPLAPLRTCGCGREFRDRDPAARCPDCLHAEHTDATRRRQFGT
ncbi:hypothetical protein AQJ30_15785 [Streptomyces longwoodensis]|uniref:Helix-turn-helix domain-containing protein n=1 Tax=Streptomyces longwoodensis TaxID=68231 RepID=A0A101QXJ2_9ACTN|nr:hypothetical protein [Streptomyces longwoodensis]KUN37743.1 hypothetical protein AQJ30_15785 [Streptomyces longwoodensis]